MICLKTQYFSLNRILLLAVGLWPYQKSKFVRLQAFLFFSILTSFVVFQLTALITKKYTFDFLLKIFSMAMFFTFYVINYNMFWSKPHYVKKLLEQLQYICNELTDENELNIIIKYGNNAKRCTTIFAWLTVCMVFIGSSMFVWPQILSVVLNINVSQIQIETIIIAEFFIDQKKYFYLILLYTNVVFCIGSTTLIATGTMLLGCIIHICGVFKIASYRMEKILTTKMLKNINLNNQIMISKKIFYAVEIHCKAMKYTDFFMSSFEGPIMLLVVLTVVIVSLNTYAVYRNLLLGNVEKCILHLIIIVIIFLYWFIGNYAGQEIINYNNHVYSTAYNIRWYMAPLHTQKMILFILQRSSKTFNLNVAGLLAFSLECFATLTKTSMSYFTVIYSTQQ